MYAKLSWLLVLVLAVTAIAQPQPKDRLEKFSPGDRITVRMNDGARHEGTLHSKADRDFGLHTRSAGTIRLGYSDVRSVQPLKIRKSNRTTWIVVAAVVVTAVIIASLFARRLGNEGAL